MITIEKIPYRKGDLPPYKDKVVYLCQMRQLSSLPMKMTEASKPYQLVCMMADETGKEFHWVQPGMFERAYIVTHLPMDNKWYWVWLVPEPLAG